MQGLRHSWRLLKFRGVVIVRIRTVEMQKEWNFYLGIALK
jgi:hypothetical protein